jgi:carbamoyl-phosphate synthase small subunit
MPWYTDSSSVEELKAALANGHERIGISIKSFTKEPYFLEMSATYKISVLDLGIKTNILRNLAKKRLLHQSILMRLMKSLILFNPDVYFLVKWSRWPWAIIRAIQVAKEI